MSSKFKYDSYGNSIEGTNYCTGIETYAQNLVEDNENDASIVFPATTGWATPRSEEFKLTTDNCNIILPQDIYKLKKVVVNTENLTLRHFNAEETDKVTFGTAKNLLGVNELDITTLIVGQTVFNAMQRANNLAPDGWQTQDKTCDSNFKDNTFVYSATLITINPDTWEKVIVSAIRRAGFGKANTNYYSYQRNNSGEYKANTDPRTFKFRVEYIPMSSATKIRARKRAAPKEDYIQPINQRAEINSASALGKFLYNTAQKTGTEQITLVRWYKHISDIPPLGCRVKHNGEYYILTANNWEMTNCVQIRVTHSLSKNWSNRSHFVSVDQKYRNYKIPADILWRNMYWEDYIEITTDGVIKGAKAGTLETSHIVGSTTKRAIVPRIFMCDKSDDVTVTSFFLYNMDDENGTGVTTPCTTLGVCNSMIFSASMKDNLSAGLQIDPDNSEYCKEVYYCNEDGTMEKCGITLAGWIGIEPASYPQVKTEIIQDGDTIIRIPKNYPSDIVFDKVFCIEKDPGEALKFTYQCHWTSRDDDIVIGSKLSENHPLVKKWETDRCFKFWALMEPLRQGADKVYADINESVSINTEGVRQNYWGLSDYADDPNIKAFKVQLMDSAIERLTGCKAWAITDENKNLYVGCNDTSKTILYFTHIHKRI